MPAAAAVMKTAGGGSRGAVAAVAAALSNSQLNACEGLHALHFSRSVAEAGDLSQTQAFWFVAAQGY